jgi:hypothetical protein
MMEEIIGETFSRCQEKFMDGKLLKKAIQETLIEIEDAWQKNDPDWQMKYHFPKYGMTYDTYKQIRGGVQWMNLYHLTVIAKAYSRSPQKLLKTILSKYPK